MDKIFFKRWALPARIGLLPQERCASQTIWIDLEWTFDMTRAAESDDITHTIDYVAVRQAISNVVQARHYDLLESLAHAMVKTVWEGFPLGSIKLAVSKPDIFADMEAVGVTVERNRT